MRRRLRILYLVPGHGLMATAGPSRNVLSLAAAMEPYADMALAFRHVIDERPPAGFDVHEIDGGAARAAALDDSAMRGLGYREFAHYVRRLHAFTIRATQEFDVILEKSWLLSGWLSQVAERRGKLGVAIENVVPSPRRHADAGVMKQLRVLVGRQLGGTLPAGDRGW